MGLRALPGGRDSGLLRAAGAQGGSAGLAGPTGAPSAAVGSLGLHWSQCVSGGRGLGQKRWVGVGTQAEGAGQGASLSEQGFHALPRTYANKSASPITVGNPHPKRR